MDDQDDLHEMYGMGTKPANVGAESGAPGPEVPLAPLDPGFTAVDDAMRAASAAMRGGLSFGEGNHYEWDPPSGRLYYIALKKDRKGDEVEVATEVMTFVPELHTIVEYGDDSPPVWLVRLTSSKGKVLDVTMREKDRQTRYAAEAWLSNVADPGLYEIVAGQEIHLLKAIKASGVKAERIIVPSRAGWQENTPYPMFIAPGMDAAISKNGSDDAIRWLGDDLNKKKLPILSAPFAPYGQSVRPPATDEERVAAWLAFEHLLACADIEVIFPLVLAVLGGPLRSHGLKENAPWLHIYGTTGRFKSSVTEAALSIFGTFARVGTVGRSPESFSSTYAALTTALNVLADLPVLVDDYKVGTSKMRAEELVRLVQAYGDSGGGGRGTREGGLQATKEPRALVISTGEQVIATQSSTLARIINVEIGSHVDPMKLTVATEGAVDGTLQLFGGAYLQWLAGREDILSGDFFKVQWARVVARLTKDLPNVHARLAPTAAGLITVGAVLLAFVKDVYPEHLPAMKKWVATGYTAMVASLSQQAAELQEVAPMATFLSLVVEQMRHAAFHLARTEGPSPTGPEIFNTIPSDALVAANTKHSTKHVGWYRDADEWRASGNPPKELPADLHGTVYLFSRDSFDTFRQRYWDIHREDPPFDWKGLKRSLTEGGVGFAMRTWIRRGIGRSEQVRGHAIAEEVVDRIVDEI